MSWPYDRNAPPPSRWELVIFFGLLGLVLCAGLLLLGVRWP